MKTMEQQIEQAITDLDLQAIEQGIAQTALDLRSIETNILVTDHDLRILELEAKNNG